LYNQLCLQPPKLKLVSKQSYQMRFP